MSSHKNTVCAAITAILALLGAGCESGAPEGASASRKGRDDSSVREMTMDDLDFGEDWMTAPPDPDAGVGTGVAATTQPAVAAPVRRTSYWGIVLRTFSGDNHRSAAANMVVNAATLDPRLARAHPHTTSNGSMVVYGVYESAESPRAQRDLKWIKDIKIRDRQVFSRAILSRITPGGTRRHYEPYELLSVRKRYANVNPLYTMQVGVWGVFDSEEAYARVQKRAVDHTQELRGKGYEAYVHHDEDKRLSMVTVGLFDKHAVDAQSGIYAPEVERLFRDFPTHLVNGQPLEEPVNARAPQLGTRTQKPRLVLVPKL
ncbi:MAG: hypothetical protein ACYTGP_07845 [Planctomycetota bacterium]|jgi:hypothetical protein